MFIFQIILAIVIFFIEMKRKRAALIDLLLICNAVFFICFVIAPICGFYMYKDWMLYSVMRYTYSGIQYGKDSFYLAGILVIIGYLVFICFYSFTKKVNVNHFLNNFVAGNIQLNKLFMFTAFLFFVSFVVFGFESLKAGGPLKWLVSNPRLYNINEASDIESNSWLADKFIRLSLFSSYLFWAIIKILSFKEVHSELKKHIFLIKFFFLLSILLSTAVVIHAGGRFLLFQYFSIFILANLIFSSKKLKILPILVISFMGGIILLYGRTFFKIFIYDDALSIIENEDKTILEYFFGVINNYTFPFFAFNNNIIYPSSTYTFFADFFLWPMNFLPTSIRPELNIDSTAINTYRLLGEYRRFIPSDIFSYGFINFGYFGIFVTCALFGVLVKKINWTIRTSNPISVIVYVVLVFLIGFRIMYFDPYHFFKGSFETIVCLIILAFMNQKNGKRKA